MKKAELKIFIGMSRALNEINRATGKIHKKYGLTNAQFAVNRNLGIQKYDFSYC